MAAKRAPKTPAGPESSLYRERPTVYMQEPVQERMQEKMEASLQEVAPQMPPPPPVHSGTKKHMLRFFKRHAVTIVPFVILLAALGYYYHQYHTLTQKDSGAAAKVKISAAVSDVEKLMFIKDDSGAQLATVTDTSKLKGQKFFDNAQNGDEIIIFPNDQRAILYRPGTHKIIEVGPYSPPGAAANIKAAAKTTTTATSSRSR